MHRYQSRQPSLSNWLCSALLLITLSPQFCRAADTQEPLSLLKQANTTLQRTTAVDVALVDLAQVTTDKLVRPLKLPLQAGIPVDLIYHLPALATCEEFTVQVATQDLPKNQLPRVELLASTLSAQSGFQTLRSLAVKATNEPQVQKLPPTAAHWIIVRISSHHDITLPLLKIAVHGHVGPPQSQYAFKEAPAKAFDVLAEVQNSVRLDLGEDELSLYQDVADGELSEWTFAEAALLSSGIYDRDQRKTYLEQIKQLTEEAKAATASSKSAHEKGAQLLKWLHKNVMANGYEEQQTDLATILTTGKFNCVSSATLYNIVGRRLDLDLRAIEVPKHAFSILYEGSQHADVETTISVGFNPARDREALTRFQEQTGFQYIPDRHQDKRREVDETGLLALTCYNHGVHHAEQGQYPQALAAYFRALNLDPECSSAIQGALSVFALWGKNLAETGKFQQSLTVVQAGLRLAPKDQTLRHNQQVFWQTWALAEIKVNRKESALDILRNAHRQVPEAGFDEMQSYVFIHPGENLVLAEQWEQALNLAATGLEKVSEAAQRELHNWQTTVYQRWSLMILEAKDFSLAINVLAQARQAHPQERRFLQNTNYAIQEWLASELNEKGLSAAEQLFDKLAMRFDDAPSIQRVLEGFLQRTVQHLVTQDPAEAISLVRRHAKTLRPKAFRDLHILVFDQQATALVSLQKWEEAIAAYQQGLNFLPKDRHLENNLVVVWDQWAQTFRETHNWSAAADIFAQALETKLDERGFQSKLGFCIQELVRDARATTGTASAEKHLATWQTKFPELGELRKVATFYVQQETKQHQQAGQHKLALLVVDRCEHLLESSAHRRLLQFSCDQWAQTHIKKKAWQAAIDAYTEGLTLLPKDHHLQRNAIATWQQWAATHIESKEWNNAISIYQKALQNHPGNNRLKQGLNFCQQQLNN